MGRSTHGPVYSHQKGIIMDIPDSPFLAWVQVEGNMSLVFRFVVASEAMATE